MKILITGGNGFIAKSLREDLMQKHDVTAYNSKELNLLDEASVFGCIGSGNFDIVIHTATYDAAPFFSTKDPLKVLENNLRMFFNIVRCKGYFGKMIYFGSGAEFDRQNWIPRMGEDYFDTFVPGDQYGLSKYLMTKYTYLNKDIYNLRLFGTFGEYDDWRYRFIPSSCARATLGLPISINQNINFDYLYINDLVRIVSWVIEANPKRNVYNVCSGEVYELRTLAEKVVKISGKPLQIIIKKEGMGKEYSGDNSLLLSENPGFRFTPIDESIKRMYDWYENNKNILINGDYKSYLSE